MLDQQADFVAIPMYDGELGVMPGRAPLIGRLGFGELRCRQGDSTHRVYVDGGFVQIRDNVVTVLTPKAIRSNDVTVEQAEAAVQAAKTEEATTVEAQDARLVAQEKARTLMRIATREKQ